MALRRVATKRFLPRTLRLAAISSVRSYASSSYESSSSSYGSSSSSNNRDSYSSSPSSSNSESGLSGSDNSGSGSYARRREELTPLTLHVKGLPPTATKEKFTQALEAAGFSGVSRVALPANVWTQGSRGFAFVTFDSPESVAKARTLPLSYEGTPLTISGARTKEESARYKVYIGDLNYNTNDADLKTALEQFGPVEYAAVTSDGGASRGYAFATFKTIEAADAARAAGKFTLDDNVVRIEKVRQSENRGERFGDRRGGSDRYGGDRYGSDRGSDRYGSDRGDRADRYGSDRGDRSDRYGSDRGDRSDRRYGTERSYGDSDSYGSSGSDRYGGSRDRYSDRRK